MGATNLWGLRGTLFSLAIVGATWARSRDGFVGGRHLAGRLVEVLRGVTGALKTFLSEVEYGVLTLVGSLTDMKGGLAGDFNRH